MAGITDLPFRNVVSKFGVDMVFSEMIAGRDLLSKNVKSQKIELGANFLNTAVQLAGCDPKAMGEAAKLVSDLGAKGIDINMGCPAKKVVGGYSGSALMRDLKKAALIIESVITAVDIPVSLKARLGWDDISINAKELGVIAETCGVNSITIHGRTRNQFYKGQADWEGYSRSQARSGNSSYHQWRYCRYKLSVKGLRCFWIRRIDGGAKYYWKALANLSNISTFK
jgi:nifR3 family TIM-barrel protein